MRRFRVIYRGEVVQDWTSFKEQFGMEPDDNDSAIDWAISNAHEHLQVETKLDEPAPSKKRKRK